MGASDRAHFFIAYDRLLDLTFFHAGSSGSRQISPLRPPRYSSQIHCSFVTAFKFGLHNNWCMNAGFGLVRDFGSEYLLRRLEAYEIGPEAVEAARNLFPVLQEWAGPHLVGICLSGSYAKKTATCLGTDVDVFVSLNDIQGQSIKDIFWELFHWLARRGLRPQAQNVSLRLERRGIAIDVVPGRLRPSGGSAPESPFSKDIRSRAGLPESSSYPPEGDHTLYWRKKDNWVQTNVAEHIRLIKGSGRTQEIRALKIWRERQRLNFSSFYLELTVIKCLRGLRSTRLGPDGLGLEGNVRRVLRYLADDFTQALVVDPCNPNNVISDDYGAEEKRVIATAARKALGMRRLEQIVW